MAPHIEQGAREARTPPFDAVAWLDGFAAAGGCYALGSDRRLCFNVDTASCDAAAVGSALSMIAGWPAAAEALRRAIESRQGAETWNG